MKRAYQAAGMLFKLHLDLLYQCDLDCEHCYLDDKRLPLLPAAFWKDVIDQAAALGVFAITLSGGEIFLRKDLLELVAHARSRGLYVHLKSHGGFIDAAMAARLAALGVSSVALSYYASDPEIHDAITRRPGSHARTRAALEALAGAGLLTIASCVVMRRNRDAWREVVAECAALGVTLSLDGQLQSALSGDEFPKALALAGEDLVSFERDMLARAGDECDPADRAGDWGGHKNCAAGHSSLYVSPAGDVTPCVMWPQPLGNLARGDRLAEVWRGGPAVAGGALDRIRETRQNARELCARCAVREACDFCAGQAWLAHGDPHQAVLSSCLVTRARTLARAAAQGLPEPPLPAGLAEPALARPRFLVRAAPRS
jgi:radical SAM protein with 4Fe4S-binding SPASM domain